jgi:glycosyltransferase involved in cell wall biosynthesis
VIVDIIHLPLLLSLHNYVVYYAQADDREYYESRLIKKIIDLLYERHFHRGNPIISMSRHLTDIFNKKYKRVDAYTIKTGIDHATFYPEPDSELVNDKGKKKAIVFMVRGDAYRKGYDIALKTFESLDKSITDRIELWVCGQQQEGSIFPFIVKNFGIVSDSRLRQILSSADIFFYPSRHEGFGLFPLEAMACGCIVVTTEAIPYAKETPSIVTSKIGDCRDLARNISTLILDEVLLHNLQEQAINESKKYDLMRSKKEFEFVLAEILQEQRQ